MTLKRTTILFTDVVASTMRAQELGDTAWATLIATHDKRLRAVVTAHEGVTVATTGDGLLATFAAPAQALRAASAARAAANRLALTIRAGVHIGEVVESGGDIHGVAVHLASRLLGLADGNEVLASEAVRDMVAGSGLLFEDRGMRQLKGFAEPWRLFALLGDEGPPDDAEPFGPATLSIPLTGELGRTRMLPCVGRGAQLERIDRAVARSLEHGPTTVLLQGDAGVGKTRLACEAARGAIDRGHVVLYGRCDEGLGVSYQPFVDALEHLVSAVSARELRPLLGSQAGELARMLPDLLRLLPGLVEPINSEPETERYRLFQAVTDWLSATSEVAPLILVIDDIQWAGDSTLRMLDHLVTRLDGTRLCLLLTYRDGEPGAESRLTRTMVGLGRRGEALTRVHVQALTAADTAELVGAAAGHDLDPAIEQLAQTIHSESGGNPFFIGEVLRHLIETGALTRARDGRWTVAAGNARLVVPDTVRDLISHRLAAMPEVVGRMLTVAALIGPEFPLDVLQEVTGETDLATTVELAQAARLIVEVADAIPLSYRFSHALIQSSLSDRVSGVRRARTHAQIAQAYETVYAERLHRVLPELARHWTEAAPGGYGAQALEASGRAARQALESLAFESAKEQYDASLSLFDTYGGPQTTRVELLVGLAEARQHSGDPAYRMVLEQAWSAARGLGDGALLARAALACSRAYWSVLGAVDEPRVTILQAAIDAVGGSDPATRATLLAELATELVWDPSSEAHYTALSDDAVALARELGDGTTLCGVLTRRLATVYGVARTWERRALVRETIDLSTELGDPVLQVRAAVHGLMNAVECGEQDQLEPLRELLLRLAPTLGQPAWQYAVGYALMDHVTCTGTPAQVRATIAEMLTVGERLNLPEAPFMAGCQTGGMHWWRDTYDEVVDDIVPLVEALSSLPTMKTWLTAIYARLGRTAEAQVLLDELREGGFVLPPDCNQGIAYAECALAIAWLRDPVAAAVLLPMLQPYADLVFANPLNAVGPVTRYIGLLQAVLGHHEDAARSLEAAARTCERMGARMWLAHVELDRAELAGAGGDTDTAGLRTEADGLIHARRALALASELDLPGICVRATAVLGARCA